MLFVLVVAGLSLVDQGLKVLTRARLHVGQSAFANRLPRGLRVVRVENPGTAFGALPRARVVHIGVSIAAALGAGLAVWWWTLGPLLDCALAFIAAGSASNALDRVLYGTVTDYVALGGGPVFNLADVALSAGFLMILVALIPW